MNIRRLSITSKYEHIFDAIKKYQEAKALSQKTPYSEENAIEAERLAEEIPYKDIFKMIGEIGYFYDNELHEKLFICRISLIDLYSVYYEIECENEHWQKFYFRVNDLYKKIINGVIYFE